MVYKKNVGRRRGRKPSTRRPVRKGRVIKKMSPMSNNFARVEETYTVGSLLAPNQAYSVDYSLSKLPRTADVAASYQFYRIAEVRCNYEPFNNTYQETATSNVSVPQLYYMMNRQGTLPPAFSVNWLETQGAKPIKFTKNILIKYTPNTIFLSGVGMASTGTTAGYIKNSPKKWISTYDAALTGGDVMQDTTTPFFGHCFMIDQTNVAGSQTVGKLTITVVTEFKQPYSPIIAPEGTHATVSL